RMHRAALRLAREVAAAGRGGGNCNREEPAIARRVLDGAQGNRVAYGGGADGPAPDPLVRASSGRRRTRSHIGRARRHVLSADPRGEALSPAQVAMHADEAAAALRAVALKRTPEHELRRREQRHVGWRAVAGLHPSAYAARAQEIEDRRAEIAAMKAGAEAI